MITNPKEVKQSPGVSELGTRELKDNIVTPRTTGLDSPIAIHLEVSAGLPSLLHTCLSHGHQVLMFSRGLIPIIREIDKGPSFCTGHTGVYQYLEWVQKEYKIQTCMEYKSRKKKVRMRLAEGENSKMSDGEQSLQSPCSQYHPMSLKLGSSLFIRFLLQPTDRADTRGQRTS